VGDNDLPISGLSGADLLGPFGLNMPKGPYRPGAGQTDKALRQAARDFESVLLERLLKEMKNTIPDSGLTGGGATKQLHGLFWSFLAREIAEKGGLGLWKDLYKQWSAAGGGEKPAPTEAST